MAPGHSYSVPTSVARGKLAEIVTLVQDPRSCVILTRHGTPVAAVVSMPELERIWQQQHIEDVVKHGERPVTFRYGPWEMGAATNQEAAEMIQQIQMDRLMEREVLKKAGLEPIPGGEVVAVMPEVEEVVERKRRWWEVWRFRKR